MATLHTDPNAPSIAELLKRLVDDSGHLFRTEIRLAKAELRDNLASAKTGAMWVALGAILLLGAIFTMRGAAVGFLTPLVGAGWAALIVAGVAGVVGVVLALLGAKKVTATSLAPDRAVASLRQDTEALKGNL